MEKVILRECETYELEKIYRIIREGMAALGVKPRGKAMIKTNIVYAHRRYATYAYSDPRVIEAAVMALKDEPEVTEITIGERTAVTIPTKWVYREAGYDKIAKRQRIKLVAFDDDKKVEVPLKKSTLHKSLHLSKRFHTADFKLYVPKLKTHASTKMTCALKLNIGILDEKDRLMFHDWRLEEKIADLIEAGNPDFIVVDAVKIGQQGELVPVPRQLGAIVMGTNSVAVDTVCSQIMGFEPEEIKYLKLASERGFGPIKPEEIDVSGDFAIAELSERTHDLDRTFSDLTELDTPIRFYLGHHPDGPEICDGGCHNMLKTAFAIMEAANPGTLKAARPLAIVSGVYEGDVDGRGLPILFVGKCTEVKGKLSGKVRRFHGCPVIVPIFMVLAPLYLKVKNPYIDKVVINLPWDYLRSLASKAYNQIL